MYLWVASTTVIELWRRIDVSLSRIYHCNWVVEMLIYLWPHCSLQALLASVFYITLSCWLSYFFAYLPCFCSSTKDTLREVAVKVVSTKKLSDDDLASLMTGNELSAESAVWQLMIRQLLWYGVYRLLHVPLDGDAVSPCFLWQ